LLTIDAAVTGFRLVGKREAGSQPKAVVDQVPVSAYFRNFRSDLHPRVPSDCVGRVRAEFCPSFRRGRVIQQRLHFVRAMRNDTNMWNAIRTLLIEFLKEIILPVLFKALEECRSLLREWIDEWSKRRAKEADRRAAEAAYAAAAAETEADRDRLAAVA
jgi:hypothetical protein